jgi:hypothetical protein
MNFNKVKYIIALIVLGSPAGVFFAAESLSGDNEKQSEKFENYKGKKLDGLYMNMLNIVLIKFPTTTLRMTMAAERGQKVVNDIVVLKPIGMTKDMDLVYFEANSDEVAFVRKELEYVLAPVEKFMEDIKEQRNIVKKLLEVSLGVEAAKKSLITKALDAEGSFLAYFNKTITSVKELNEAAMDFLVFFADVSASLSEPARNSYDKLLEKLRSNKKQVAGRE